MTALRFKPHIEKRPLLFFFLLTFLISWIGWGFQLAYALQWISFHSVLFSIMAGLGPAIAAVILTLILSGLRGAGRLLGAFFRKGARWTWFLIALVLQPLITLIALGLERLFSIETFDFANFPGSLAFLTFLAAMLVANIWEELGWRGFALPLLQRRMPPLWAGALLGLIWGAWHLPAFFIGGTPQDGWSFAPFFLGCVALSLILTPLFNTSGGSILLSAFFHFQMINPLWPDAQPYDSYLFAAVAVAVVWVNREQMLNGTAAVTEVVPVQTRHCRSKDVGVTQGREECRVDGQGTWSFSFPPEA